MQNMNLIIKEKLDHDNIYYAWSSKPSNFMIYADNQLIEYSLNHGLLNISGEMITKHNVIKYMITELENGKAIGYYDDNSFIIFEKNYFSYKYNGIEHVSLTFLEKFKLFNSKFNN